MINRRGSVESQVLEVEGWKVGISAYAEGWLIELVRRDQPDGSVLSNRRPFGLRRFSRPERALAHAARWLASTGILSDPEAIARHRRDDRDVIAFAVQHLEQGWALARDGCVVRLFALKEQAVREGKRLARRDQPSHFVVIGLDRRVQVEHRYGDLQKTKRDEAEHTGSGSLTHQLAFNESRRTEASPMARKVWEVEPRPGGWAVQRTGTKRADSLHPRKSSAIARGQELAKGAPLGQLRIKGGDGKIEREWTYGKDPRDKRG